MVWQTDLTPGSLSSLHAGMIWTSTYISGSGALPPVHGASCSCSGSHPYEEL